MGECRLFFLHNLWFYPLIGVILFYVFVKENTQNLFDRALKFAVMASLFSFIYPFTSRVS